MPFSLCNGPASWQHLINDKIFYFLHQFVQAYLDDIFISCKALKDHHSYVRQVLQRLQKTRFQTDVDKCEYHVQETKFLRLIISTEGVQINPQKVNTILAFNRLRSPRHVTSFLEFCHFYWCSIRDFSKQAKLFTSCTKKDAPFD